MSPLIGRRWSTLSPEERAGLPAGTVIQAQRPNGYVYSQWSIGFKYLPEFWPPPDDAVIESLPTPEAAPEVQGGVDCDGTPDPALPALGRCPGCGYYSDEPDLEVMTARAVEAERERDEARQKLAAADEFDDDYRQAMARAVGAVAQAERERDELALTLANERGEGAGPSEGWEYDFAWDGDTPINFGWHNGDAYVENGTRYDEGGWRLSIAGKPLGKHPTARAAMLAADAALKAP